MAEKIEIQTKYAAELYNVDVRQDQRYLAEKDLFPCGDRDVSRFSPDFEIPLSIMGMEIAGNPNFPRDISCIQVLDERKSASKGSMGRRRCPGRPTRVHQGPSPRCRPPTLCRNMSSDHCPRGPVLIDTAKSFVYTESGLKGRHITEGDWQYQFSKRDIYIYIYIYI